MWQMEMLGRMFVTDYFSHQLLSLFFYFTMKVNGDQMHCLTVTLFVQMTFLLYTINFHPCIWQFLTIPVLT